MGRPSAVVLALLLALACAGCPQDFGFQGPPGPEADDDDDSTPVEDPYWCCDPDQPECRCPGYWLCTEGFEGKVCRQANPPLPDDGTDWVCEYEAQRIVCEGRASDHPDAGSDEGWSCETDAGNDTITCERAAGPDDYPDEGTTGEWNCTFSSSNLARACSEGEEQDDIPDDGGWLCRTGADGQTTCTNGTPETPDDAGDWLCYQQEDGTDVCQSNHVPDDGEGEGWVCTDDGEIVTCENSDGEQPDTEGEGPWECAWSEELTVRCHDNPDGGGPGDVGGEGEGEGGGDDEGGGGGPGDEEVGGGDGLDCECIAGAQRYCDEPDYCLWGTQDCQEWFGQRTWGPCEETNIPAGCAPGGALARDYAWHFEGGFWDNWQTRLYDGDGDGILVYPPDFWFNPAGEDCAIRAGDCAQDMWDLDQDGDNQESVGDCADIQECV